MLLKRLLLLILLFALPSQAEQVLVPERTHAVILGVVQWNSPQIPPFPKEGRQDEVLVKTLQARGIPSDRIAYLQDAEATRENIQKAFARVREQSLPGDTLIFYYSGHGTDWNHTVRFYEYDAAPNQGMTMSQLSDAIGSNFKGDKVLLLADCCFSGGLEHVGRELEAQGFLAASITSSKSDAPSGATWTYTMAVIDCFLGIRPADGDLDHRVTLEEMKDEVWAALAYTQRQEMGYSFNGLSPQFAISFVTSIDTVPRLPEPFHAFDYARLMFAGSWRGARLMDYQNEQVATQIQEYASRSSAWLPLLALRPNGLAPRPVLGSEGEIQASLDGRYQELLARIEVKYDHLDYPPLYEAGLKSTEVYGQHDELPQGFWVYLYPYWYIWARRVDAGEADGKTETFRAT